MAGEARLLRASLRGDHDAFARIVRRYQSLVCAITYSGTGDLAASEDLAQETFLTAWRRLGSLREPARLRAWLCTIARNLTTDHLRRRRRDPLADAVPVEQAAALESAAPTPAEQAAAKEREQLVWDALQDIPETYRVPLVLYYREQQSVRRVARELELSRAAVRQRLTRGRGMLRDKVASLVEDTLSTTAPGGTFAAAVLAGLAGTAAQKATGTGSTVLGLSLAKATAVGVLAAGVAVGGGLALHHAAAPGPEPERAPAVAPVAAPEPEPAERPVLYADRLPDGLAHMRQFDFHAFLAGARALEAKTGVDIVVPDGDEALLGLFHSADLAILDLDRPVFVVRTQRFQPGGEIAVFGLGDPEEYAGGLPPRFVRVPGEADLYAGEADLYTDNPAGNGLFIGIVGRTAVQQYAQGAEGVRQVMALVRDGTVPQSFLFPREHMVAVYSSELMFRAASRGGGGLVAQFGIMKGSPLAGILDSWERQIREGVRALGLTLRFREDDVFAKWQFAPVAGGPLEALLAGYPRGRLELLGHLPADSIVALACKLPDLSPLAPAAGGQPLPLPARALALVGDEAAFAFGRSPTGTGLLHLAARVRDPAACGQLMNQLAAMAAGLLANPQAGGPALPLRLQRSATSHNGVAIHVWDFDLTGPLPDRRVMAFLGRDLKLYEFMHGDALHLAFGDGAFEQVQQIIDGTLDDVAGSADFVQAAGDMPDQAVMAGLFRFEKLLRFGAELEGQTGPLPFAEGPPFVLGAHVIGNGVLELPIKVPHPAIGVFTALQRQRAQQPLAGGPPGPPLPELHRAARDGNRPEAERLLGAGADANAEDDRRRTPLHLAAEGDHRAVVEALLAAGADVNATDLDGRTPAGLAVRAGHDELADLLREHGGVE